MPADQADMPRRLVLRLLRLDASFLRVSDPVRTQLELELIDMLPPPSTARTRRVIVLVHHDAHGVADTTIPN